ncbi:MAG: hypothetical protein N2258_08180 [Brevinematales bacterium]|nr:hypothetical protein [Brevinematales bacterium]
MLCPNCNKDTPKYLSFCKYCGYDIHKNEYSSQKEIQNFDSQSEDKKSLNPNEIKHIENYDRKQAKLIELRFIKIIRLPVIKTGIIFMAFSLVFFFLSSLIFLLTNIFSRGGIFSSSYSILKLTLNFIFSFLLICFLSFISGVFFAYFTNFILKVLDGYEIDIKD